jgi:hypothetical protein
VPGRGVVGGLWGRGQQPQQTGMPFIMTQQVQPAFIMPVQQSQQAWIMAQQALSPLVQVMQTPLSVISHLHRPIIRLQQQAIMPFIIVQQEHMPPAIMVQRFCIMLQAVLSSQVQVIFMPPSHFSIVIAQRGTIIMFMPAGIVPAAPIVPVPVPMPGAPIPGIAIPARSIIKAFIMGVNSTREATSEVRSSPSGPAFGSINADSRRDVNIEFTKNYK